MALLPLEFFEFGFDVCAWLVWTPSREAKDSGMYLPARVCRRKGGKVEAGLAIADAWEDVGRVTGACDKAEESGRVNERGVTCPKNDRAVLLSSCFDVAAFLILWQIEQRV